MQIYLRHLIFHLQAYRFGQKLNLLEKEFEEKEQRWLDLLEMEEAVKKENE